MRRQDFILGHGRFDAYPEIKRRDTPERREFWGHVDRTAERVEARMQLPPRTPLPEAPVLEVLRAARQIRDMIRSGGAVTDETGSIFATLLGDLMVATDKCDGIQLRTSP